MESNLFIKSYKAEGNKITDLQFYGDMEIDIGSGGGSEPTYKVDIKPNLLEQLLLTVKQLRYLLYHLG